MRRASAQFVSRVIRAGFEQPAPPARSNPTRPWRDSPAGDIGHGSDLYISRSRALTLIVHAELPRSRNPTHRPAASAIPSPPIRHFSHESLAGRPGPTEQSGNPLRPSPRRWSVFAVAGAALLSLAQPAAVSAAPATAPPPPPAPPRSATYPRVSTRSPWSRVTSSSHGSPAPAAAPSMCACGRDTGPGAHHGVERRPVRVSRVRSPLCGGGRAGQAPVRHQPARR